MDDPGALRAHVQALLADWEGQSLFEPRCDSWSRFADRSFSERLGAAGLIGLAWPAPYGAGASYAARLVVTEELLRAGAPVASHWIADRQIGPALVQHGSPDLQEELLPDIAAGRATYCLGLSEPEAGSDLAALRSTAVPCEGGFRLRGRKVWTTGAHIATHAYVLARTTPLDEVTRKHEGLSELIVDMSSPGLEVTPILDMSGHHHFNEVSFDDVLVPSHRLVGEQGQGWRQVTGQLAFERGGPERVLSTYPLMRRLLASDAVAADPALLVQLGELVARLGVLRRLCHDIALSMDTGVAPVVEAATAKFLGNRFEVDVIELARGAVAAGDLALAADTTDALLTSPGFGIRGGAADVLLAMITRSELSA